LSTVNERLTLTAGDGPPSRYVTTSNYKRHPLACHTVIYCPDQHIVSAPFNSSLLHHCITSIMQLISCN